MKKENFAKMLVIMIVLVTLCCKLTHAVIDSDSDGISDSVDAYPYDYDNDGMPDIWEKSHGLRFDVNDAGLDSDNDGLTNIEEYSLNRNPMEPDNDILDKDLALESSTKKTEFYSPDKKDYLLIASAIIFVLICIFVVVKILSRKKTKENYPKNISYTPNFRESTELMKKMLEKRRKIEKYKKMVAQKKQAKKYYSPVELSRQFQQKLILPAASRQGSSYINFKDIDQPKEDDVFKRIEEMKKRF